MLSLIHILDCERLLRSAGSFTLRFLCPDPYGYALDDETLTLSQAGEHEVEREIGNTDSEPVYSLQGTISSGTIVDVYKRQDNVQAGQQVWNTVNLLLRLDREWKV